MSKYINAEELIEFCTSKLVETKDDEIIQAHNNAFRCVREHIKSLKAADAVEVNATVEVIRCKDCAYFNKPLIGKCKLFHEFTREEDFCSNGERKKRP